MPRKCCSKPIPVFSCGGLHVWTFPPRIAGGLRERASRTRRATRCSTWTPISWRRACAERQRCAEGTRAKRGAKSHKTGGFGGWSYTRSSKETHKKESKHNKEHKEVLKSKRSSTGMDIIARKPAQTRARPSCPWIYFSKRYARCPRNTDSRGWPHLSRAGGLV